MTSFSTCQPWYDSMLSLSDQYWPLQTLVGPNHAANKIRDIEKPDVPVMVPFYLTSKQHSSTRHSGSIRS